MLFKRKLRCLLVFVITLVLMGGGAGQTGVGGTKHIPGRESIEGLIVEYPAGAPLAGCKVTINSQSITSISTAKHIYSADQGKFKFAGLVPGDYLVSVETPGGYIPSRFSPNNQIVHVKSGEAQPVLRFVFARASKISGMVVSMQGQPIPGVAVDIFTERYDPITAVTTIATVSTAQTNADGSYQVEGIPPGRYRIGVRHSVMPDNRDDQQMTHPLWLSLTTFWPSAIEYDEAGSVVVAPGQDRSDLKITVRSVQTNSVSGTWVRNNGDKRRQPSEARLVPLTTRDVDLAALSQPASIGEDGAFRIENVAPGRYRLELFSSLGQVASREVIVGTGFDNDNYAFYEGPGEILHGEISAGKAIPDLSAAGLQLMLIAGGGSKATTIPLKTDKEGRFQANVCSCLYRVLLQQNSGLFIAGMTLEGIDVTDATLDLRQSHGDHLVISLSAEASTLAITPEQESHTADGQPFVVLFRLGEAPAHPVFWGVAPVRNGGVTLSGVRPGRYGAFIAQMRDLSILTDPSIISALENKMKIFETQAGMARSLTVPVLAAGDLVESARQTGTELF